MERSLAYQYYNNANQVVWFFAPKMEDEIFNNQLYHIIKFGFTTEAEIFILLF